MSRREDASSLLKLQPHIYSLCVYKSLRRPHIPEACKERGQREETQPRLGTDVKMCEERPGGGVVLNREVSGCFIPAREC